jgi:hypothetical protein
MKRGPDQLVDGMVQRSCSYCAANVITSNEIIVTNSRSDKKIKYSLWKTL